MCSQMVHITTFFSQLVARLNDCANRQQQQLIQQKNLILALQIQEELCLALHNSHLPKLISIEYPCHIRFEKYKTVADGTLFYYSIDKTVAEKQPAFVLEIIKKNMNVDIARYQQELFDFFPEGQLQVLYPVLYAGLYVLAVTDQPTAVQITVATHYII